MGATDNAAVQAVTQNLQSKSTAKSDTKSATSGLSGAVGMGAENAPDDVMKVSGALAANGLMDAPQSHADSTLFKGMIGAQERMDRGSSATAWSIPADRPSRRSPASPARAS